MSNNKKNLLIFFGELRTFEYVVPHLRELDKVDIIISTWSESKRFDSTFLVNEELIKKIIPNVKKIFIVNSNEISDFDIKTNSWKMFFHWKNAINNINNNDYENVIVHRTDLITNWHRILNYEIEKDTIYFHHDNKPYECGYEKSGFWINDYYFFGKFDYVKKFINLFNKDNYGLAHIPIYNVVTENDIKYKNYVLGGFLVKDERIEYLNNKFNIEQKLFNQFSPFMDPTH